MQNDGRRSYVVRLWSVIQMMEGGAVPEDFDPHRELDRIHSLKEIMVDCRRAAPLVIEMYRRQLDDVLNRVGIASDAENGIYRASTHEVIALGETILSRAYGKPRQQITVNTEQVERPVKVYVPDNGREKPEQQWPRRQTIDVPSDATGQES